MRAPIRKGHARMNWQPDPYLTPAKQRELEDKLERWKARRPVLAQEVKRLAEMGDFSENAGYQLAKGRLRGLNQRILDLEKHLSRAVVIRPDKELNKVQIGSVVTVLRAGQERKYTILGSTETDPDRQVISYLSPLGAALMGHTAGDEVVLEIGGREVSYKIVIIEALDL